MNPEEWLASANPQPMLDVVSSWVSDRKLRLFACACCRQVWDLLTDPRSRQAVEVAERYADGQATAGELVVAKNAARSAAWAARSLANSANAAWDAANAAWDTADVARSTARAAMSAARAARSAARADSMTKQANALRCIVGNPCRPCAITPAYPIPDVLGLAQAAYSQRQADGTLDPFRLAMLADALEEAGCGDELLDHLRSSGPHYRGCWAVDLVLGKE